MNQPIHDLLSQLGAAITAQLDAANDRAASAEIEYARLRDGLRALVGGDAHSAPAPANDIADITAIEPAPKADPVDDGVRNRIQISDEPFLTALTSDWLGAHAIRKVLLSSGLKVAYGTVYKRMAKLAGAFPDMIEEAVEPVRWRLRSPSNIAPVADALKKTRTPVKGRRSKSVAAVKDMPPAAITDVRERVAAATPPVQMFSPVLHRANCFDAMKTIGNGSIDLILTDPPYSTTGLDIDPQIDLTALWAEYRRIIKPTGTIIIFGSQPFTSHLVWEARDLFKHDLVWIKNNATGSLQARNRPLKQHEDVLVFSAGTTIQQRRSSRRYTYHALGQESAGLRTVSKGRHSTYLRNVTHNAGRVYEGTKNNPRTALFCRKDKDDQHPFQKPLDLLEYLIRTYSNEGDLVLDSFMGSGSTCVAAMRAGRRSIGIETTEKYFRVAEGRMGPVSLPLAA